ncbi:hypothetical protein [Pengzhenrongella sicca]|uniref:Uncharacterized protein n=1 Tax=Pengzhenrongella sicca TaxID=2819238 RepID=A0A8A4Z7Q5_9MICO|nr:hypothetical protein [Pengzhenrongella sicca]QTE27940.1 hypothetical protein J4E96_11025 [Pengzhenrongella sicca]
MTAATIVSVAACAAIWWVAVPMEAVCPAVYPAPVGCTAADRQSAGVTWTIALAVSYVVTVAVALTIGRRYRWLTRAAMSALVVVAVFGFGAVQGSTGVAFSGDNHRHADVPAASMHRPSPGSGR